MSAISTISATEKKERRKGKLSVPLTTYPLHFLLQALERHSCVYLNQLIALNMKITIGFIISHLVVASCDLKKYISKGGAMAQRPFERH